MAKVSFTKLGLKVNQEIKTVYWNEQMIEVKQYLPVQDKLQLISNVINQSLTQDISFANPVKFKVFFVLEVLECYTNISLTEKMKEDPTKLFDMLESTGLMQQIISQIPEEEYITLKNNAYESLEAFYKYKNSVMGVVEALQYDYENVNFDLSKIVESIKDPEALKVLKEIAPLMG